MRRIRRSSAMLLLACLCYLASLRLVARAAILDDIISFFTFDSRRFKYEGLIDAGSLGLDSAKGLVGAVADVNGNQVLDLVVVGADQASVTIWAWNKNTFSFQQTQTSIKTTNKIVNIIPGDYNHDGRLDLLIMSQSNPGSWWSDHVIQMDVHLGMGNYTFAEAKSLRPATGPQPMVLDYTGNMRPDLLGIAASDSTGSVLKIWENTPNDQLFDVVDFVKQNTTIACKIADPHSNAFIDLNGDCLAVCVDPTDSARLIYQIYTNEKSIGFVFSQSGSLPQGTGQIAFADIDRDGTIDMIFPSCSYATSTCSINIAYNQQIPLCSIASSRPCREASDLCTADNDFHFDLGLTESNSAFQQINLGSITSDAPHFVLGDKSFAGNLPLPIHIGDYNQDGYPDLLVISSSSASSSSGRVSLLQSVACTGQTCAEAQVKSRRRSFAKVTKGADALNIIRDARAASFFDIDEQGSLDILVQRGGKGGISRAFTFIKNNFFHDAFFLKALVLNGACEGKCIPSDPSQKAYAPNGISYSGASYKFTVFDQSGSRRAAAFGQYPQTSYLSLLSPYSFFGLGRTNNYVENLFVGTTRHQTQHFLNVEGVIPNSQVLVEPWQSEDGKSPDSWRKSLYLHPGDWIPGVLASLLGAMLILAITVIVLHKREAVCFLPVEIDGNSRKQREDDADRKKRMAILNFDAL